MTKKIKVLTKAEMEAITIADALALKEHKAKVKIAMDAFIKEINDDYEKDIIHLSDSKPRTTNFYKTKSTTNKK